MAALHETTYFRDGVPFDGELTCDHLHGLSPGAYRCGQVWGIAIEVGGCTLYHQGSADLLDGELAASGVAGVDVFLAGVAGRNFTERYWERILPVLDPALVVPTHYDDFFVPLDESPEPIANVRLAELPEEHRQRLAAAEGSGRGLQWLKDKEYEANTVGRQMDKPLAVFSPDTTVQEATARLRELAKRARLHLAFVTEADGKLLGVFAFRELLFSPANAPVSTLMNSDLVTLNPSMSMLEATKAIIAKHHPAYPVVDGGGRYRSWPTDRVRFVIDDPLEAHVAQLPRYTDESMHDVLAYLHTLR